MPRNAQWASGWVGQESVSLETDLAGEESRRTLGEEVRLALQHEQWDVRHAEN